MLALKAQQGDQQPNNLQQLYLTNTTNMMTNVFAMSFKFLKVLFLHQIHPNDLKILLNFTSFLEFLHFFSKINNNNNNKINHINPNNNSAPIIFNFSLLSRLTRISCHKLILSDQETFPYSLKILNYQLSKDLFYNFPPKLIVNDPKYHVYDETHSFKLLNFWEENF